MNEQAMMELYNVLSAKPPKGVRGMSEDDRREYNRLAKAKSRQADRVTGTGVVTDPVAREALADAALAILATGAEGSAAIEKFLQKVFEAKPAVVVRIVARARTGKLKPRLVKSS